MTERIATAAIRLASGAVVSVEPPGNHAAVVRKARALGHFYSEMHHSEQGFTTTHGRFVDRAEGAVIADACGQRERCRGPGNLLFSEDLW